MKKALSLLLTACLLLSLAPVAFADDAEEMVSQAQVFTPDEKLAEELADSEELLDSYAEAMMEQGYAPDMSTGFMAWGRNWSEAQNKLYDLLKAAIENIVSGKEGSNVGYISIDLAQADVITINRKDITTIAESDDESTILTKAYQSLNFDTVMNMLLANMPYELYWYNKTVGTYNWCFGTVNDDTVTITKLRVIMPVSKDYVADSEPKSPPSEEMPANVDSSKLVYNTINNSKMEAAKAAVENAKEIIEKYKNYTDYDKLMAFRDEICRLASYNRDVAIGKDAVYGDPWQIIYVFDNDEATKVVCEGYAKAFQYLCDNGELSTNAVCYTVTGTLANNGAVVGDHMWNIVEIGGKSYLVDLTNSDEGDGSNGKLFLAGGTAVKDESTQAENEASTVKSYEIKVSDSQILTYTYDENTLGMDKTKLALSDTDYKATDDDHTADDVWSKDDTHHWQICTGCGEKINYAEHSSGNYHAEDDDKHTERCKECGTIISTAAHEYKELTEKYVAPTEEKKGSTVEKCSLCSHEKIGEIPSLSESHSHVWGDWKSDETKHWKQCTAESCYLTDNSKNEGYGEHSFGAYRIITAATATTSGLMKHECTVCGYSETSEIPASGIADSSHTHSWGSWQFTSPNYWERTCSTCGNREVNVVSTSATPTPTANPTYTIISGANQVWVRGNDTALTFRADIPFSEFKSVMLNGVELPSSYYTASEGSTIITLKDSCTKELKTGVAHTIKIVSTSGAAAETSFIVQSGSLSTSTNTNTSSSYAWASPKTGDSANIGLWISMVLFSLMGMTAAVSVVLKKENK